MSINVTSDISVFAFILSSCHSHQRSPRKLLACPPPKKCAIAPAAVHVIPSVRCIAVALSTRHGIWLSALTVHQISSVAMWTPLHRFALHCDTHLMVFDHHRIPMLLNFTARFSRTPLQNNSHIILAALVPLHPHLSGCLHTGRRPLQIQSTWLLPGKVQQSI